MTAQEAIEYLELAFDNSDGVELSELYQDMCKTAIAALEEIQQYRATGLTPQMVNDLIKSEKEAHKIALENANLIDDMSTIEAVPVVHGFNDNQNYHEADEFRCLECGLHLEDWRRTIHDEETREEYFVEYTFKYCPECGAKMKGGME